ncbi:MAG: dihydroorotate dehydrogenase electron transfer subunit [Dehalococcoidia bacterium]
MPGVHLLRIEAPEIADESYPGQFVTIRCGEDVLLRRPFSIHKVARREIEILFTKVGPGTEWLAGRTEGEFLDILGPLGNGFEVHPDLRNILLVAGGIGVAPLVYLAESCAADGFSVKMLLGATTVSQLYSDSMEGVEVTRITEDGSEGEEGMVTDFLTPLAKWADQIFACGPVPMYLTMGYMLEKFEDKPVQVLLEQVMGCGVGACRGCAVPTIGGIKMVCRDGPAFDLRQLKWEQMRELAGFRGSD